MHILIPVVLLIIFIYGPYYWASHVIKKYNKKQYFSGNGIQLARMLLDRMNMEYVKVEETDLGDHYDPVEKVVRLNKNNCGNKSLTAVVVAAHEVGHAIQAYGEKSASWLTKHGPELWTLRHLQLAGHPEAQAFIERDVRLL